MEIEGFYRTVLGKIDAEVRAIDDDIVHGRGIADWVAYQRQVARRAGVLAIRNQIEDIFGSIFKREPVKQPKPGEQ